MSLTKKKYMFMLTLLYICMFFDIGVNSFWTLARSNPANLLLLFVIQDFCLIIALTILLAIFFSTYVFQAGLIQLLYKQFRLTLLVNIIYIILSISLHSWHMTIHWTAPLTHYWPTSYHCLYASQRITAAFYYYLTKRASLRISDPRFHEGSKWMQSQFSLT